MRFKLTFQGDTTYHKTLGQALAKCGKTNLEEWSIWDTIEQRVVLTNDIISNE